MPLTRRDFVRTVFVASQTALAGQLVADPAPGEHPPADALNIAIIGDWGRRGRPDQKQVAAQMALACKKAGASFVISVGDNFYEDGVASLDDPHWHQSFESVYDDALPWHVVLGNHDYRGIPAMQLEYAKTHPRWIMPSRYWSQTYPVDAATKLEIFYIDTSPMIAEYEHDPHMPDIPAQDVGRQLAWLEQALAASKAQWKWVVGHHPVYSTGGVHGDQRDMVRQVLPILLKHKVPVYFAGHDHDLEHLKTDRIDFFVSGGGSEHRPLVMNSGAEVKFGRGISGFAMASVRANDMQVRFIDNLGNLLYATTVPRVI